MFGYNPYNPYRTAYGEPYSSFSPYGNAFGSPYRAATSPRRQPQPQPQRRQQVRSPYHESYVDDDEDDYGRGFGGWGGFGGFGGFGDEDDELRDRRARAAMQEMYSRPPPRQQQSPQRQQQQQQQQESHPQQHQQQHHKKRHPHHHNKQQQQQQARAPSTTRRTPSPQKASPSPSHTSSSPPASAPTHHEPDSDTESLTTLPAPTDEQLAAGETFARLFRRRAALRKVQAVRRRFAEQRAQFAYPSVLDYTPVPGSEEVVSVPAPAPPSVADDIVAQVEREEQGEGEEEGEIEGADARLAYTARNAPLLAYSEALLRLLNDLDAVESAGDVRVREARRAAVRVVEGEAARVDRWWRRVWARRGESTREGVHVSR
ncbi:hypothetical protein DENSPDRAFT_840769 [Dentipellis sp. KUC8613]|nr:hypothetical protein DENSPDRAFT_840769 [Dentipellis sp. KUC8613]